MGVWPRKERDNINIHGYLKSNKKAYLFSSGSPGDDWWKGFLERYPEISLRKPQALQICRAKASTPETINHWFIDILKK